MATNKELTLIIQPKVIDHLGIKMYQKPVDVISEFVANAWDADSETVSITLSETSITVKDQGIGMTFDECQNYYLTVGRDRRKATGSELTFEKNRPVLGRKGIGKFAGFGIAQIIVVETISKATGERSKFKMDLEKILEYDAANNNNKPIEVLEYDGPNAQNKSRHGSTVILEGLSAHTSKDDIKMELSRRFLLTQFYDDFKITVNSENLPESFSDQLEFIFPRDLTDEEKPKFPNLTDVEEPGGWGIETFNNKTIKWRIGFYEDTIKVEELRGISVFAKGKLAQKSFFFDLSGGISGQNALEYMTGQVILDFIDEGNNDLIATERQRINLQTQLGKQIQEWGIQKIKVLSSIWKARRSQKRLDELNNRISGFQDRLNNLTISERKTVEAVLKKIASFSNLGKERFQDLCNSILTSWETGRLKNLISEISLIEDLDETKLLEILSESDVLTALNIAESIKTKIVTIGELKERVTKGELENAVRDFIYNHPWLIHPKWESFKKERSVKNIIDDLANRNLNTDAFNGRVDLALSSGSNLLLVEFMRPGISLDANHLERINYYVIEVKAALSRQTGATIQHFEAAYVIADDKENSTIINARIQQLFNEKIYVLTWETLIEQAIKQWEDYLELLKERNPNDKRLQNL